MTQLNKNGERNDVIDGMVNRGLFVRKGSDGEPCLGCLYHSQKQFYNLHRACDHFRMREYHKGEEKECKLENFQDDRRESAALPSQPQGGAALPSVPESDEQASRKNAAGSSENACGRNR